MLFLELINFIHCMNEFLCFIFIYIYQNKSQTFGDECGEILNNFLFSTSIIKKKTN